MFLHHTSELIRRGIVSRYQTHEDNLPYLKGRLLFPQQAVINSANKARFYVQYDDYTPNHAANRLVCRALHTLRSTQAANEQRRRQLLSHFDDVAPSVNIAKDWQQHSLDRGMRHYTEVMQWVRLLLYKYGLATYQGDTNAASLLFPMERVFENFVAKQFRLYAKDCTVHTQQPRQYMVRGKDENADDINMFQMQPDIMLEKNNKKYIVDTKWKEIKNNPADKYNISQSDMYQLYSYGRLYQCEHVALIYPANEFLSIEHSSGKPVKNYIKLPINQQNDKSAMIIFCLPFNIDKPEESVRNIINTLSAHS